MMTCTHVKMSTAIRLGEWSRVYVEAEESVRQLRKLSAVYRGL